MSGFPTRPNRPAFGPTYQDARRVDDPSKQMSAQVFNLGYWQLAGCGIVVPMGKALASGSLGVSVVTVVQRFAFDPLGQLSPIVWTRTGVGVFTCQLAATYANELGAPITTALRAGMAWVADPVGLERASFRCTDLGGVGRNFEAKTFNAAGSAADLDFWVQWE